MSMVKVLEGPGPELGPGPRPGIGAGPDAEAGPGRGIEKLGVVFEAEVTELNEVVVVPAC